MFVAKIQPLYDTAASAGAKFKPAKESYIAEFESRGIPFTRQTHVMFDELAGREGYKRRTLKSVSALFPNVPRKEVQALAKFVSGDNHEAFTLLDTYQKAYYGMLQEIEKQKHILSGHIPEDWIPALNAVYEEWYERAEALDDDVRRGLK